ncbi:hypothetical protein QR680_005913 [Steinernema hermaphroditum]|uniref:Fibronectin type-III domain-containing protein n=1 Tax=Steinernema hermaphroditum TaxID=289476 RepID=A0AA39HW03_9BILA|nr:hypothetical protein QR680_005913 [Steinernema hermaphroditum]
MTTFRVALLLLLLVDVVVRAQPSRRAQCAIECYSKCMLAGTPNAVYCNCPVAKSARVCVGATEEFLQRKLSAEDLSATTEYLSAHSIRIATTSLPKTFMNIFEYTEIENLNKSNVKWTFAGASSGHDLTFSVNDPCREYAYRVISILKTSDAENHLTVYRSQTISTTLPSFSVNPELIKLDEPEYSQREEMITVTAIWMNPGGYLDTDIAGVEAPEAYPIQCQSPEGALPEPKVELFYNGGRISVDLPSDVLAERCRYLFQVKVLPKCGRLEPFTVQTHIEVNCENFPSHPICSRERAPQCTNIVDVWGSSKNATVMWKLRDQDDKPLYYHVRHGPVESKGAVPFVSWKIVKGKEEKVRPEVNSLEVEVKPDQDYGVQVCAVYSKLYRSPKFDLVSVTPFVCTPCSVSDTVTGEWFQKCEECSKIEGEVVAKGGATSIKVISMEAPLLSVDAKKPSTKLTPVVETKTTVPSSTVVMTTETTTTEAETMPPTSIDLEETSNDLSVSEALLFPPIASRATEEAPSPSTTTPREIRKHQKSTTRVPVAEDCANPPPNCRCETDPRCCFLSTNDDDCVRRTNKSPPSTPTFCLAKEELAVTYELDSRTARVRATSLPERISEAAADSVWIGWRPHVPGPRVTASDVIDASEVTRRGVFTQKLYNLKMPKGVSEMSHEIRICVVNSTDIDSNRVVFALNDKSLKLQTKKEFEERPADSAALSQALLFYGPLSAIFLLVIFILGIIYLNCSRIRRFYERKRIYNLHPGTLRAAYRPYNTQYRGPFYHYGNTRVYQA